MRGDPPAAGARSAPAGSWAEQLARSALLTAEEELLLADQIQAGIAPALPGGSGSEPRVVTADARRALDVLVTANIRFAYKYAHGEARRFHMDVDDLAQEAHLGLLAAAKRYRSERGLRFLTYALWWIRSYIGRRVLADFSLVKVGTTAWQRNGFARAMHDGGAMTSEHGEARQLRRDLSLSLDGAQRAVQDGPTIGGGFAAHEEMIVDGRKEREEADAAARLHAGLARALQALEPREREVIRRRYDIGSDGADTVGSADAVLHGVGARRAIVPGRRETATTLAMLGKEMGVSRERVRQLEMRALEKLKRELRSDAAMRALLRER